MANIDMVRRAPIKVTLSDGIERTLRYTLNSFARVEEEFGDIDTALEKADKGSLVTVRFLLWTGLVSDNKELTEDDVGDLIDMADMHMIAEAMSKAIAGDTPSEKKAKGIVAIPNA